MKTRYQKYFLWFILAASAVGLYYGWKLFWFLTDDAHIAFRYISNSILGHGFTWNPPPFKPVEGYTSFLWVLILDQMWRWFGVEPPVSSNCISLALSYLTLGLICYAAMRIRLTIQLRRYRLVFLILILAGVIGNRTFLAWTSSGLETALFNFCFTLWIVVLVYSRKHGSLFLFGITGSAVLTYLTRPDGLLLIAATLLVIAKVILSQRRLQFRISTHILAITPLIVPVLHLYWRKTTYGEWLPNTYYAKYVEPWPEAGMRYLASFILEYALWIWIALLLIMTVTWLLRHARSVNFSLQDFIRSKHSTGFFTTVAVLTVITHMAYYTFNIGGDHFEYRVYSYTVPLIFLSFVWITVRTFYRARTSILALSILVLLSYPIPWIHWDLTKDLNTRKETRRLTAKVSDQFPSEVQWYTRLFDNLQADLIQHSICMRHQEHKVFCIAQQNKYLNRTITNPDKAGQYPVIPKAGVCVPAWAFPEFIIIDTKGLNDYVVARHQPASQKRRQMAHERTPPDGYLASFYPNVIVHKSDSLSFRERTTELTKEDVVTFETYWRDIVLGKKEVEIPPRLPFVQGQYYISLHKYSEAGKVLETAASLNPYDADVHKDLAFCLLREGLVDSVITVLRKADHLKPEDPTTLSRLGSAYLLKGNLLEGQQYLQRSLTLDNNQVDAMAELAAMHVLLKQPDSAKMYLASLINSPETPASRFYELGNLLSSSGYMNQALPAYENAILRGLHPKRILELIAIHPELKSLLPEVSKGN